MPNRPSQHSLSDIADRFKLTLEGGDALIDGVGTLRNATSTQISFLANPGYRPDLPHTRAAAVILKLDDAAACPTRCLVAGDPYLAYARVAALFAPELDAPAGIHPTAVVDATAVLGTDVSIGPNAVIGARCTIGDGCHIGPGTVIEAESQLGRGCRLYANVTVDRGVRIGERVIIHPGAVIGADGFGIALDGDRWHKVPQLGSVRIGNDCEIGANTTIDRGAVDDTVLEEDVRVDNLVQIAHNVHIGAHTAIAAMTGIAGSARIGRYCLLAGGCGVTGHIEIADRVTVAAKSSVFRSIEEPGTAWSAQIPAQPLREWQRNLSLLRRLDEFLKRIRTLERSTGTRSQDQNDQ
jgi:UDP-3-O-[3-hydroxymyristoyl] glucosamine N-acyltransferase